MSDSAIPDIYTALTNLPIGGVKARNITGVRLQMPQADLPLRLLLPSTGGNMSFVAIGTLQKLDWTITDVCLWAPLGAGGIQQYAGPMLNFIREYIAALKSLRAPTSQSYVTGVAFQMGPLPWGDDDYWAVSTTVQVSEVM